MALPGDCPVKQSSTRDLLREKGAEKKKKSRRRPQRENMSLADSNVSQPPITCKAVGYFGISLPDGRGVSYPVLLVWCVVEFSASNTPILSEIAELRLLGKVVQ